MGKVKITDCNGCPGSLVAEIEQSLNHTESFKHCIAAVFSEKA